jgi:hypothetical protein
MKQVNTHKSRVAKQLRKWSVGARKHTPENSIHDTTYLGDILLNYSDVEIEKITSARAVEVASKIWPTIRIKKPRNHKAGGLSLGATLMTLTLGLTEQQNPGSTVVTSYFRGFKDTFAAKEAARANMKMICETLLKNV